MENQTVTVIEYEQYSVEDEQIAHLAGVIDSSGSVTIRVRKDTDYRLDYTLSPQVSVRRANEEDPILGKLMAYCEEHGVKFSTVENSHGADEERTSIELVVKDMDSVERFLEPLMDYLVTKYYPAEAILEYVIPAIREGEHTTEEGFIELMGIADEIRSATAERRGGVKYTQEYFKEKWSATQ